MKLIPFKYGYRRVKLVGKKISRKITVLRQLLGMDLKNECFPAVSSGKTIASTTGNSLENRKEYKLVAIFLNEKTIKNYLIALEEHCIFISIKNLKKYI